MKQTMSLFLAVFGRRLLPLLLLSIAAFACEQGGCQQGWCQIGRTSTLRCFRAFGGEEETWCRACESCRALRGRLVTIRSQAEQQDVVASLMQTPGADSLWIGLYKPDDGYATSAEAAEGWMWQSGSPATFSQWAWGEPNDDESIKENCGGVHFEGGKWNDADCSLPRAFVCEVSLESSSWEFAAQQCPDVDCGHGFFPAFSPHHGEEDMSLSLSIALSVIVFFMLACFGTGIACCYWAKCCCWSKGLSVAARDPSVYVFGSESSA